MNINFKLLLYYIILLFKNQYFCHTCGVFQEKYFFYAFNFIDSERGRWASDVAAAEVAEMGIKWVPILDTHFMMPNDMEEFKQMATAKSAVNPAVMREGIVLRDPATDFSFKNVSREYLLKHE